MAIHLILHRFSYNDEPNLTQTDVSGCKLNYFFHCPQQGLQKPFIFIEGFDPIPEGVQGTQTFKAMLERLKRTDNLVSNQPSNSMFQRLYDEGYDLIYVDFTNGAGDIPANAQVVKNVIRRVNALKAQNGNTTKTRVLGASMGGVVGKWAIREMERDNEAHDIDKFITFDSPLRGANVPMGIQFMIKDLETRQAQVKMRLLFGSISVTVKTLKIGEFVPGVMRIKRILTAPAAQQMLFYNAFTPSGNPREWHDAFYARLAALGDLQVDYSVVSNGSSINQPQLLNAGELYAKITGAGGASALGIPNLVRVALDLRPFAIPASGSGGVYSGTILIRFPVSSNVPLPTTLTIDVGSQLNSNVSNLKPLDSAPGGFSNFDFPDLAPTLSFDNVNITADFGTKTKGLWCFVPTFSALDIAEPTNVNQNFTCSATNTRANRCVGSIDALAFSKYIGTGLGGTAHNQDHVSINQRNATFLLNQLAGGAGLNNLAGSLTRTYNFGISDETPSQTIFQPTSTPNVIARGLTVEGTGRLWVNRSGRINFTDENNLLNRPNATFNLSIRRGAVACNTSNTSVIIQNGGVMQLGDPSVNNTAITRIEAGATLDIRADGTLRVEGTSQIVVENGGRLIINGGANINLVGAESTIYVKSGGELVINGTMAFSGNGFFQFDAGHILTLNSGLVLRGSGKMTRLIRLNTAPYPTMNTLTINGLNVTLSDGLVEYGSRCQINITNGINEMNAIDNMTFNGGYNGTALNFVNVANVSIQGCDFNTYQGVSINSDINLLNFVNIGGCNFNDNKLGLRIRTSEARNVVTRGIFIHDCRFDYVNSGSVEPATACRFENLFNTGVIFARTQFTGITDGVQWADLIGIDLRNTSITLNDAVITRFKTGIIADKDAFCNINLVRTELSNCETGANIIGDVVNWNRYGHFEMSCSRLTNNQTGVRGRNVAFNINQGLNVFQNSATANSLLFDVCYSPTESLTGNSNFTNIQASNNFWVGGFNSMRFSLNVKTIPQGVCQTGIRRLEQCVEWSAPPTNCTTLMSCCNRNLVSSDGNNGIITSTPIFCLMGSDNSTTKASPTNKTDKEGIKEGESVESKAKQFSIHPNPASETVNVEIQNGDYHLRVLNTVGQTIFAQNTEGPLSVNVATWTNGIYLFELTDKATNKRQRSKVVVQH